MKNQELILGTYIDELGLWGWELTLMPKYIRSRGPARSSTQEEELKYAEYVFKRYGQKLQKLMENGLSNGDVLYFDCDGYDYQLLTSMLED